MNLFAGSTLVSVASGCVRVCVRDNGPGISTEMMERLFGPFGSTKQGWPALGLAFSRTIVGGFGGRLAAEKCAS